MYEYPGFFAILLPNFEQFVGESLSQFAVFNKLLKFLLQRLIASAPVNQLMHDWEEKC